MTGMNDMQTKDTPVKQPSILYFVDDLANLCSLAGLFQQCSRSISLSSVISLLR